MEPVETPFRSREPDILTSDLASSRTGLAVGEARRRLQQSGPNLLATRKRR